MTYASTNWVSSVVSAVPVAITASASSHALLTTVRAETGWSAVAEPKHGHGGGSARARLATTAPVNTERSPIAANAGTDESPHVANDTAIASSAAGTRIAAARANSLGMPKARICAGRVLSPRSLEPAEAVNATMSAKRAATTSVPTQLSKWP